MCFSPPLQTKGEERTAVRVRSSDKARDFEPAAQQQAQKKLRSHGTREGTTGVAVRHSGAMRQHRTTVRIAHLRISRHKLQIPGSRSRAPRNDEAQRTLVTAGGLASHTDQVL